MKNIKCKKSRITDEKKKKRLKEGGREILLNLECPVWKALMI